MTERYFMAQDQSCHWYVIPIERAHDWEEWVSIPEDDERAWDAPDFAKAVGGSPACVTFSNPIVS